MPPAPSVTYVGPIIVGEALPSDIATYPVPRHRHYRYAVINGERVILDRRNRIVRVMPP